MIQDQWITTSEAAVRLGVTTARIRQMVAENQLSARKIGGKYRGQWQIQANPIVQERLLHLFLPELYLQCRFQPQKEILNKEIPPIHQLMISKKVWA